MRALDRVRAPDRVRALLALPVILMLILLVAPPTASAAVVPAPSAGGAAATLGPGAAAAPFGPYSETLTFTVQEISPQAVTRGSGTTLRVRATMTNTGSLPVTDLNVRFHRGTPVADQAALRALATDPGQPGAVITAPAELAVPGGQLEPGASAPLDVTVSVVGEPGPGGAVTGAEGLAITEPGVYPVMININGTLLNGESRQDARIGELHLVSTVLSLPGGPAGSTPEPVRVSLVRTIADRPHLGIAGVFADEALAASIAPGGELDRLLTELEDAPPAWSATLVIDPMLVDELHRMSSGYRVLADPAAGQPALTPEQFPTLPTEPPPPTTIPPPASTQPSASDPITTSPITSTPTTTPSGEGQGTTTGPGSVTDDRTGQDGATGQDGSDGPAGEETRQGGTDGPGAGTGPGDTAGTSAQAGTAGQDPAGPAEPVATTGQLPGPTAQAGTAGQDPAAEPAATATGTVTQPPDDGDAEQPGAGRPPSGTPTSSVDPSATAGPSETPVPSTETAPEPTVTIPPAPVAPALPGTVPGTGQDTAAAALQRIRDLAGRLETVVLPYGNPDLVALTAAGMQREYTALVKHGRKVAADLLPAGVRTDIGVPPEGYLSPEALETLTLAGYTSVLASSSTLADPAAAGTTALLAGPAPMPTVLTGSNGSKWWSDLVTTGSAPAAELNLAVADLVLDAGSGSGRTVVLAGDQPLPDAAGTVVRALTGAGLLAGTRLPDPASATGEPLTVTLPDEQAEKALSATYLAQVRATTGSVSPIAAAVERDGEGPDPAALFTPLTSIEVSAAVFSSALRTDQGPARKVLRTIDETLDGIRAGVFIRFNASYSLASASSPLVFTVQNTLPYITQLKVKVAGGQAVGIEVADPGTQAFPAARTESVVLESRVTRSGAFSVDVGLVTADGTVWAAAQPVTVTSSAYGFVTIVIIVVAGTFLVVMVVFRVVQRIRGQGRGKDGEVAGAAGTDAGSAGTGSAGTDDTTPDTDPGPPGASSLGTESPSTDDTAPGAAPGPPGAGSPGTDDGSGTVAADTPDPAPDNPDGVQASQDEPPADQESP